MHEQDAEIETLYHRVFSVCLFSLAFTRFLEVKFSLSLSLSLSLFYVCHLMLVCNIANMSCLVLLFL
jgi:hypothetical protein